MADHAAHIADLVGTAHIGLGPDFLDAELREMARVAIADAGIDPDLADFWIPDGEEAAHLPTFSAKLLERGFSADDVRGIIGGNFMRVFEAVWG
jgi:membrane dipeptidase